MLLKGGYNWSCSRMDFPAKNDGTMDTVRCRGVRGERADSQLSEKHSEGNLIKPQQTVPTFGI